MKLNWNIPGGQGVQNKKPSVGGVWIFSGTAQCKTDMSAAHSPRSSSSSSSFERTYAGARLQSMAGLDDILHVQRHFTGMQDIQYDLQSDGSAPRCEYVA